MLSETMRLYPWTWLDVKIGFWKKKKNFLSLQLQGAAGFRSRWTTLIHIGVCREESQLSPDRVPIKSWSSPDRVPIKSWLSLHGVLMGTWTTERFKDGVSLTFSQFCLLLSVRYWSHDHFSVNLFIYLRNETTRSVQY